MLDDVDMGYVKIRCYVVKTVGIIKQKQPGLALSLALKNKKEKVRHRLGVTILLELFREV